jgi:hypothetical protein
LENATIDPFVIGLLAWAIGFGLATAWLARRRDRIIVIWAAIGAILGPVALFILWVAPPGRCATCRAPVSGWLTTCLWCGMDVRGGGVVAAPARAAGPSSPPRPAEGSGQARPLISVAPTVRPLDPPAKSAPRTRSAKPPAAVPPPAVSTKSPGPRVMQVVASGVFVTGTVGLSAGSRYSIQMDGVDLQVLGPGDRSPKAVAFERQLAGFDATGLEGRLILTAPGGRGGTVLVFMSMDSGDPSALAESIARAAQAAGSVAS